MTPDMKRIVKIMKDRVEAIRTGWPGGALIKLPDGCEWLNEHDVREQFKDVTSELYEAGFNLSAFGRALHESERQGIVERGAGPGCTSIRLT